MAHHEVCGICHAEVCMHTLAAAEERLLVAISAQSTENTALRAEVRALREALAGMLDVFSTHHEDVSRNTDDGLCSCESHAAIHKARALLGDTK